MKKRHNIDTIAEVLIDKISQMEKTAEKIEDSMQKIENLMYKIDELTQKRMKIDTSEFRKLIGKQDLEQKTILKRFKELKKENEMRAPNWIFVLVCVSLMCSIGFFAFNWKKIREYDNAMEKLAQENEFQEMGFEEIEGEK
jgi:hypothetical protein